MITVGELLKDTRLEKGLSLEQVEKVTKIRTKFLKEIENNNFGAIDSQTVLRGFIKNYASFLGLSIAEIMAFYRRQSEETVSLLPKRNQISNSFRVTPKLFTASSIILFVLIFVGFLVYQYISFSQSPPLTISSPKENSIVSNDEVSVIGKTDPDATVEVNNQGVHTDVTGSFEIKVPLTAGLNIITIKSTNKFQKTSVVTRHLRLEQ